MVLGLAGKEIKELTVLVGVIWLTAHGSIPIRPS
jgi:hypothetical protein